MKIGRNVSSWRDFSLQHDDAVRSVRWLPARNLVVTAGSDIKHWDLRAGDNPVRTLKLEGRVWAMDHADDTLVACTSNYSVNVYKMGAPDRVFRVREGCCRGVFFNDELCNARLSNHSRRSTIRFPRPQLQCPCFAMDQVTLLALWKVAAPFGSQKAT